VVTVELHPPQHMRAACDDQVGAGVHRHVRKRLGVATVFAGVGLLMPGDVVRINPLGTGVHVHDDEIGSQPRPLDQRPRGGKVEQVGGVGVGREGDERHPHTPRAHDCDLARKARLGDAGGVQYRHGLFLPGRTEVIRVVVGVVENGEPGIAQVGGVRRRRAKRVAVGRVASAFAARGGRERPLQVAEHDLGVIA